MVVMTRTAPEAPNQPTRLRVPDCDIDKLKKRGWRVEGEVKTETKAEVKVEEPKEEPVVEETKVEAEVEEEAPKARRRRGK